jgi:hypothetical protein
LDTKINTVESLGELYFQRWTVELHFRELKTFLGMEILRCRSPHMIKGELQMHLIAYNVIRHVMQSASLRNHKPLSRISFKGSLDTARHWAPSSTPPANPHANSAASFWTCYASSPQTPFSNAPVDPNPAPKNADPKIFNFSQNPENPWATSPEETAPPKIQGKIPNLP